MAAAASEVETMFEQGEVGTHRTPRFELVPSRLSVSDARELRWFCSNPPIASVNVSNFGASLARAGLFGLGSTPCLRCGGDRRRGRAGTGFSPTSGKPYRRELAAHRRVVLKELNAVVVKDAAAALKSREMLDMLVAADDAWKAPRLVTPDELEDIAPTLPLEACRPCRTCGTRGIVPRMTHRRRPITARPTGSSVPTGGSEALAKVDGAALVRWGIIDRHLGRCENREPGSRCVLETYYDPAGGDLTCLWLLTDGGRGVAASAENPLKLPLELLLHNERQAQKQAPSEARRAAHARASRESSDLFDRSCRAWNATAGVEAA